MNKFIKISLISIFFIPTTSNGNPMISMAVMLGAQEGASLANVAINQLFSNLIKTLMQNNSTLSNSMEQFAGAASQAEKIESTLNNKILGQAMKHINMQESSQSNYTTEMTNYILKAVSLHKPETYYLLAGAVEFDQAFTNGTMYTPEGRIWKNIFGRGNWEYNEEHDSFIQINKTTLQRASSDSPFSNGIYNSIFTEFQTFSSSYEITIELTLHSISYPFCAGILFNKSRWISGNADSLTKSRLAAIYGSDHQNIGLYFSEQKKNPKHTKDDDSNPSTLYSLDQIITKSEKPIKIINEATFKNIHNKAITFIIKIQTSPKKVGFKIWEKSEKEPKQFITEKSADPNLFMYHDIGFISPGAITEFKILDPKNVLFDTESIESYRKEVNQLIHSKN